MFQDKVRQSLLKGEMLLVVVPPLPFGKVPRAGFMHAVVPAMGCNVESQYMLPFEFFGFFFHSWLVKVVDIGLPVLFMDNKLIGIAFADVPVGDNQRGYA